jgi:hypothetical protein
VKTALAVSLIALGWTTSANADAINLGAARDTTIYGPNLTANSNGGGGTISAGTNGNGEPRRGLLCFDLTGIPSGAVIENATLILTLARSASLDIDRAIFLHRLLADWGENQASDAGLGMGSGMGVPAQPGDATWMARFFDQGLSWSTPGGDFVDIPSATTMVTPELMPYYWSSPGLLADVKTWIATPATNFGWIVQSDEDSFRGNRQFHSRETLEAGTAPTLQITYSVLRPLGIEHEFGGGYRLRFRGKAGQSYTLEFTPGLAPANWLPLGVQTADAQGEFSIVDVPPTGTLSRFYRAIFP